MRALLLGPAMPAAIAGAIAFAFLTTWIFLSPLVEKLSKELLTAMIVGNVVIAAALVALIATRMAALFARKRSQQAGSRTHLNLAAIFALVAVTPAIIAFLFAFTILRTSLNNVFGDRIVRYRETAQDLANDLIDVQSEVLKKKLTDIAFDIARNEGAGVGFEFGPIGFREYLLEQARRRDLAAIMIIADDGHILVRAALDDRALFLPPRRVMDDNLRGKAPDAPPVMGVNDVTTYDMFRGGVRLPYYGGATLFAYQPINPKTTGLIIAAHAMGADWANAERGRGRAENIFLAGYILLGIIILCGAIWLALSAATRIVQPIGRLVGMAERVSSGDLRARVDVERKDGEIGDLARAMNHMTAQLQTQRDDLVETNRQFDRRRRFTEAVLKGVSAGVVGVSGSGRISIANDSAAAFLGADADQLSGRMLIDVIPEFAPLIDRVRVGVELDPDEHLEIRRNDRAYTLSVRIAADVVDGEASYIVTFDDITQLIAAQRNAAWGDVARRIAHEIKNPLTPIQLSAERLRRKYRAEITSNPDIFDRCTETIVRHVSDIGRMVDEFSSFARMPKPVIAREDLRELARTAIFSQRVAFPEIDYVVSAPEAPVHVQCDGRLIVQALSNLLKNAGESVSARLAAQGEGGRDGRIKIVVSTKSGEARVDVCDNGLGLPKGERHRLTEPYMTTRVKGTGLGLAIVKKVVEEHGGSLAFDDDVSLGISGARVSLILPADDAAAAPARAAAE